MIERVGMIEHWDWEFQELSRTGFGIAENWVDGERERIGV